MKTTCQRLGLSFQFSLNSGLCVRSSSWSSVCRTVTSVWSGWSAPRSGRSQWRTDDQIICGEAASRSRSQDVDNKMLSNNNALTTHSLLSVLLWLYIFLINLETLCEIKIVTHDPDGPSIVHDFQTSDSDSSDHRTVSTSVLNELVQLGSLTVVFRCVPAHMQRFLQQNHIWF